MAKLAWVSRQLRAHCPWTAQLTHRQLTGYMIEEAYEAVEVIESRPESAWPTQAVTDGVYEELRKELGDVLFQVALHSAIAEQVDPGGFNLNDVAEAICEKMIRRNPHVFTPEGELLSPELLDANTVEEVELAWERLKQAEKQAEKLATEAAGESSGESTHSELDSETVATKSIFNNPAGMPALSAAASVIARASRHPGHPVRTPEEYHPPVVVGVGLSSEEELGAELFELIRAAQARGLDAERALREHLQRIKSDLLG